MCKLKCNKIIPQKGNNAGSLPLKHGGGGGRQIGLRREKTVQERPDEITDHRSHQKTEKGHQSTVKGQCGHKRMRCHPEAIAGNSPLCKS